MDDIQTLFHHFSKDIDVIMAVYQSVITQRQLERSSSLGQHVIACASSYEAQSWKWAWQYLNNPVTIVTNSIELIVLKGLKCVSETTLDIIPVNNIRNIASYTIVVSRSCGVHVG